MSMFIEERPLHKYSRKILLAYVQKIIHLKSKTWSTTWSIAVIPMHQNTSAYK